MAWTFKPVIQFEQPLSFPDFDKRAVKAGHRTVGKEVRAIARKLVSRKAVSKPGEFPGKGTGALQRAIRMRVSKSGFSVAVYSQMKEKPYYPAFVVYGHRGPGSDSADQGHKKRKGHKSAAPRANYIWYAANKYANEKYAAVMSKVLDAAIKPGVIGGGV